MMDNDQKRDVMDVSAPSTPDYPAENMPKQDVVKKAVKKHGDVLPFIMPSPISMEVGSAIIPFVDDRQDGGRFINELIPLLRHGLYYELGVNFPGVQVRGQTVDMEPENYVININEVPVAQGKVMENLKDYFMKTSWYSAYIFSFICTVNNNNTRADCCIFRMLSDIAY